MPSLISPFHYAGYYFLKRILMRVRTQKIFYKYLKMKWTVRKWGDLSS